MSFLTKLLGLSTGDSPAIKEAIEKGAVIIDVRTPAEFAGGHPTGARNIPLKQLSHKVNEIKAMNKPVVLCCASGARSSSAKQILGKAGINDVHDAGGWRNVPC